MKKIFSVLLAFAVSMCIFAGCGKVGTDTPEVTEAPEEFAAATFKIAALNGPTGMGISKLIDNAEQNVYKNTYNVELFSAPTDVTGLLINGEIDVAALPTNLASTLFNKTNGKIQLLALNTLGVLYVLEKGDTVHSIKDLQGKKIYSSGQASTPEYALDYVLKANDVTCEVEYFATHAELATQALQGNADIILIPEPMASTVMMKNPEFRVAIDFNKAWDEACNNTALLSMGCLVARKDFVDSNKDAVEQFLKDYAESVDYVNKNPKEGAELVSKYGIVASSEIAEKAIPNSNMVTLTGNEMKLKTQEYLKILFDFNPAYIGGALPGDEFYY